MAGSLGDENMKKKFDRVYQFKVTLADIRPPIWRRIRVPENYTFWDLYVAIQDAMGWADYHLHKFTIFSPKEGEVEIGIPDPDWDEMEILHGRRQKIADYFSLGNREAEYVYDFGDYWEHMVRLEKILPLEKGVKYPLCIKGKRACPPEDCGGAPGYEEFLDAIRNPKHEQHKEMLDWIGGRFDPEDFDVKKVIFDNPNERWEIASE